MPRNLVPGVLVLCLLATTCGPRVAFRTSFPDNRPEHIRSVLARLPAPALPSGPSNDTGRPMVVVTLEGEGGGLAAFDASSGDELWRVAMPVDSPPQIGGPVVVVRSGQAVLGLSVHDGRRLWRRQTETLDFMGAAIDAGRVYLSFSTAGQRASAFREGRLQALDATTGRLLWSLGPVERQLGAPAASGGLLFVPWDRLSVSAFDGATGVELARILTRDDVYSFVVAGPEGVFYGSSGLYRLSERSAAGVRGEQEIYEPLVGNAPRAVSFAPDSFMGTQAGRSALSKVRFLWRGAPGTGGRVDLVDDRTFFLYFRVLIGFEASTGTVVWARQHERDAEVAAVVPGGVLLLDGRGRLEAIDAATGSLVHRVELGVEVASAAFDVAALPRGGAPAETRGASVREQLLDIVFDPDSRLAPARRFAVSVLASIPDEEVTRDLLGICEQRRVPEVVRNDAAMVLRTRQSGARYLREALAEPHDFLADREAPPVGVIAASVLNMRDAEAVPQLLEHLRDPETAVGDIPPIVTTVAALGDASVVPDLLRFLITYRADSAFESAPGALVELARAIVRLGEDDHKDELRRIAELPHTHRALVEVLPELLAPPEPEAEASEGDEAEPRTIAPEQVDRVMQSARDRIRPCIQSAIRREPELSEVRLTMVVAGDGDLEALSVEPADDILGSCLSLSLAEATFPRSTLERQRLRYTIRIER